MQRTFIPCARRAFTLIELLVVIAIVGILAGLLVPSLAKAKLQARFVNELNSAKQLMVAHKMYTDDHEGRVLPGYRFGFSARGRDGSPLQHPTNARYPWRIAPYLADNFEILYVNKNRGLLHSFKERPTPEYTYAASLFPSLAANSVFVGGDDQTLPPTEKAFEKFGRFCVLKETEVRRPAALMTFVSARSRFDGEAVNGFYRSTPPRLIERRWPEIWQESAEPETFGFVHPRYSGRAVTAMLDGHAEGLDFEELQDMRRWANPADRADWTLERQ